MNRKRLQSRPDRVFTEGNEIEELAKAAENEEFEEIESEDEDDKTSEDGEKNGEEEFEVLEKKKVRFSERKTGKPKSPSNYLLDQKPCPECFLVDKNFILF